MSNGYTEKDFQHPSGRVVMAQEKSIIIHRINHLRANMPYLGKIQSNTTLLVGNFTLKLI